MILRVVHCAPLATLSWSDLITIKVASRTETRTTLFSSAVDAISAGVSAREKIFVGGHAEERRSARRVEDLGGLEPPVAEQMSRRSSQEKAMANSSGSYGVIVVVWMVVIVKKVLCERRKNPHHPHHHQ